VDVVRSVADWMAERGVDFDSLMRSSGLDRKVLEAILASRYTPSPQQRRRVAEALGVGPEQVLWGHTNQVDPMYGHGPQFGRSP
jgi:lambda repressor-like predicted transcriptional regulator